MAHPTRTTIKDVAQAAGVSPGVASSVLNGNRHKVIRVSAQTQQRIRSAAAALRYRPNTVARSLRRRRTQTLMVASYYARSLLTGNLYYAEVLDGALARATARGYDLLIHVIREQDGEKPGVLGDGRADGCLWVVPRLDDAALPSLATAGAPVVLLGARIAGALDGVLCDNRQGMAAAVGHLVDLGHTDLMLVETATAPNFTDFLERRAGFQEACAQRGLRGRIASETEALPCLRGDAAARPSAVIGCHDRVAARVMEQAQSLGLSIPRDLSVVGFDSTGFCETLSPALTSVRQPIRAMAERAVDLLITRIEDEEGVRTGESGDAQTVHILHCGFDIRGSTAPAPGTAA